MEATRHKVLPEIMAATVTAKEPGITNDKTDLYEQKRKQTLKRFFSTFL